MAQKNQKSRLVEIDEIPFWSEKMYQNMRNGMVFSIETSNDPTGYKYDIVSLPENYYEDNQIIDIIGEAKSIKEAESMIRKQL